MWHPKLGINDDWIDVLKAFPDRFVIGTDSFVVTPGYTGTNVARIFEQLSWMQRGGVEKVLSYLDSDLARKIGYENAMRIYNLSE